MRAHVYLLAVLPLLTTACLLGLDGNGDRVDEARVLDGFAAIDARDELEVLVERGDTFSVTVSIDENLQDVVRTRVEDGRLRIDTRERVDDMVRGPHVRVTMPHLTEARHAGSGRLDLLGFQEPERVQLSLSGSGELAFEGSARVLDGDVSGSGDMVLIGTVERVELEVRGSGTVDAKSCVASSASLRAEGSGDLSATVNGSVDATVRGSGNIDLFGAAVLQSSSTRGSGDIRVHR